MEKPTCVNGYSKGALSYQFINELNVDELENHNKNKLWHLVFRYNTGEIIKD